MVVIKKEMQGLAISTVKNSHLQELSPLVFNRGLIYDSDKKTLYVKYNNMLCPVTLNVDNKNILYTGPMDQISLSKNVNVSSTNSVADGKISFVNKILAKNAVAGRKTIYLLLKVSDDIHEQINGNLFRLGKDFSESYFINVCSSSKVNPSILGSSNDTNKAEILKFQHSGNSYYGIKFQNDIQSSLYFCGYYGVNKLTPPDCSQYYDNSISY